MSSDIEQVVTKCSVCMKYQKSQHKEPMIPHNIIDGRWKKIAMDITPFKGHDYLVLMDYYSKYPKFTIPPRVYACGMVYQKKLLVTTCLSTAASSASLPETGASR